MLVNRTPIKLPAVVLRRYVVDMIRYSDGIALQVTFRDQEIARFPERGVVKTLGEAMNEMFKAGFQLAEIEEHHREGPGRWRPLWE